ncbi:MAG: hypothetical protein IPK50_04015 [Fibrobacterota bacterium]|nr:MAG: hypothetical protein IPK50_04015 [Fibrobacterota bacterium]
MNARILRAALALSLFPLFTGCISISVTSVKAEGDLALPPPPVVPDAVLPGKVFVQAGLRLNRALEAPSDSFHWDVAPLGGDVGVQYVLDRRMRFLGGASVSSTPSGWVGFGLNVRNTYLAWDFESLLGATWANVQIHGRLTGEDEESTLIRDEALVDRGTRLVPWTQFAIRTRLRGSGPWLEARVQPGLRLGKLTDTLGDSEEQTVSMISSALGAGWIQEFPSGSMLVVGARMVESELENKNAKNIQGLASWVRPF